MSEKPVLKDLESLLRPVIKLAAPRYRVDRLLTQATRNKNVELGRYKD